MAVRDAAGDVDFSTWVEPHLRAMSLLAARLVPDTERDDVVQEALERAWRRRSSFDAERGTAQGWLLALVLDRARASWRRGARRRTYDERSAALDPSGAPVESRLDLRQAVARLSPRQRLAVDLYYYTDLDIATTAQLMRCSPGTVKATLAQARARLEVLLTSDRSDL